MYWHIPDIGVHPYPSELVLTAIIPRLQGHIPDSIYNQIPGVLSFGVDDPLRLSSLLGQSKLESQNFTHFTENLNYSAQGLANTWPTRYAVDSHAVDKIPNALAIRLAHNPEAIANNVYAGRMGNGDEASGDGHYRRGVGCIQLTGKSNQETFFIAMGLPADSNPQLIATTYQLASAAYFFNSNHLWTICDKGVTIPVITELTKRINGGTLGLSERIQFTQEFYHILTTV